MTGVNAGQFVVLHSVDHTLIEPPRASYPDAAYDFAKTWCSAGQVGDEPFDIVIWAHVGGPAGEGGTASLGWGSPSLETAWCNRADHGLTRPTVVGVAVGGTEVFVGVAVSVGVSEGRNEGVGVAVF